jgi:hypothetical protein
MIKGIEYTALGLEIRVTNSGFRIKGLGLGFKV